MTRDPARTALTEQVARAVEGVEGVAFLRPGVAQLLRSALPPVARPTTAAHHSGVRLSRGSGASPRQIDIQIVARREARALDVARATRKAVESCLATVVPAEAAAVRVAVTITGLA
ncbi:hypothetical protein [Streptomyces sp. NPDC058382]|uniref:hypothetical protein n=1 Tax=unclassified Streptomyces TaxID=2593676 RepID=UPI00363B7CFB